MANPISLTGILPFNMEPMTGGSAYAIDENYMEIFLAVKGTPMYAVIFTAMCRMDNPGIHAMDSLYDTEREQMPFIDLVCNPEV